MLTKLTKKTSRDFEKLTTRLSLSLLAVLVVSLLAYFGGDNSLIAENPLESPGQTSNSPATSQVDSDSPLDSKGDTTNNPDSKSVLGESDSDVSAQSDAQRNQNKQTPPTSQNGDKSSPPTTSTPTATSTPTTAGSETTAKAIRIVDGDTIELEGKIKLRYIGMDTPEVHHPTKGKECLGEKASQKNAELVLGKQVRLEKDISETDRYGRLLRYVYVDGDDGEIFVNQELVKLGLARAKKYPPDTKYHEILQNTEKEAQANKLGIWGTECEVD